MRGKGEEMYVTGTYRHNLDAKQRLTLPSDFRRQIDGTVYLVKVLDCVYGFTPEGHQKYVESLFPGGYNPRDSKQVALRRYINGQTVMTDVDSAGRVSLSKMDEKVHEMLGREVVIMGNTDHFEIWNAAAWDSMQAAVTDEDFAALMFNK